MKKFLSAIGLVLLATLNVLGLSTTISRDIHFPKNFDAQLAGRIREVVRDEQFKFVEGTVSFWPPDWSTHLSFEGASNSFNQFLNRLRAIDGINLKLVLYKGRNDEGRRDSDWQLRFSHDKPRQLTIYLNLNAENIVLDEIDLPMWMNATR